MKLRYRVDAIQRSQRFFRVKKLFSYFGFGERRRLNEICGEVPSAESPQVLCSPPFPLCWSASAYDTSE